MTIGNLSVPLAAFHQSTDTLSKPRNKMIRFQEKKTRGKESRNPESQILNLGCRISQKSNKKNPAPCWNAPITEARNSETPGKFIRGWKPRVETAGRVRVQPSGSGAGVDQGSNRGNRPSKQRGKRRKEKEREGKRETDREGKRGRRPLLAPPPAESVNTSLSKTMG